MQELTHKAAVLLKWDTLESTEAPAVNSRAFDYSQEVAYELHLEPNHSFFLFIYFYSIFYVIILSFGKFLNTQNNTSLSWTL